MSQKISAYKVKGFMKKKGHKDKDLNKKKWGNKKEVLESLMELHGLEPHEFRHYGLGKDIQE